MSDNEEEREMIRKHKIEAKKASAELDRQDREATKAANERIRLYNIEHDKLRKLGLYAKSILKNIKDVPDVYSHVKNKELTTEKDVDKYIKLKKYELINSKPKKDTTIKDIKKMIKELKNTKFKEYDEDDIKDIKNRLLNLKNTKYNEDTIKEIKKMITELKNIKFKEYDENKNKLRNEIINLASEIFKSPKHVPIETESVQKQIDEVEKLLKANVPSLKKLVKADKEHLKYHPSDMDKEELKLDTKIMKQAKEYNHKVKNISHAVKNYVDQYIDIYKNSKTPQSRGKQLNELKLNVYTNLRPSDIDDANTLIEAFKKTLDPIVKKKAIPKQINPEDKKYKSVSAYVKKNKPNITNEEDIDFITTDLINKDKRMSKKLLDEVLKDYGY
jgi:hypothetical protein